MRGRQLPDTWRGGDEMKKLVVAFDDQFYLDLKALSRRRQTTMAGLVRFAVDKTFEDELDVIAAERSHEEYLQSPDSAVTLDDYLKERGIALPGRTDATRAEDAKARTRKAG